MEKSFPAHNKNKHISTLVRKKNRKTPRFRCCGRIESYRPTKPTRGYACGPTGRFLRSRDRRVIADLEINAIMKMKKYYHDG